MAFTQSIDTPSVASAPTSSGASSSAGDVSRLKGVENLVNLLGGAATAIAADSRAIKQDEVKSQAQQALFDLESERVSLLDREKHIAEQTVLLSGDGQISEEDRDTLARLEQEKGLLRQARDTGVLSRSGYSTRLSAIYRSALSDANNLGIQSEIGKLFAGSRTQIAEPSVDPQAAKLQEIGDSYFGKGNYTTTQVADLLAKQTRAGLAMREIDNSAADHLFGMNTTFDMAIRRATNQGTDGDSIITEQERAGFLNTINQQLSAYDELLFQQAEQLKATGGYTKAHADKMAALQKQARDLASGYIAALNDPNNEVGARNVFNVLERQSKMTEFAMNVGASAMMRANKVGGGQGLFGEAGAIVAYEYLDPNNHKANQFWDYMASKTGGRFTAEELRTQQTNMMLAWLEGSVSNKELLDRGMMDPDLYKLMVKDISTKGNDPTKEEVAKIIEARDIQVDRGDSESNIKTLVTLSDSYSSARDKAVKTGQEAQWKTQVKLATQQHALELQNIIEESPELSLKAFPDGTFDISVDSRLEPNEIPASTKRKLRIAEDHAAAVSSFLGKALSAGDIEGVDLMTHFGEDTTAFFPARPTPEQAQQRDAIAITDERVSRIQPDAGSGEFSTLVSGDTPPPLTDPLARTAWEENRGQTGFNPDTGVWVPHKSVEGGNPTLAYGHKLTDEEVKTKKITLSNGAIVDISKGISDADAQNILADDLIKADDAAQRAINAYFDRPATETEQRILQQMAYQLGRRGLLKFDNTLTDISEGKYASAANRILKSEWAKQTPERAKRIAEELKNLEA